MLQCRVLDVNEEARLNYRTLGRTGLRVSEIGFGGAPIGIRNYIEEWDPDSSETEKSVQDALMRALDVGINYFDTATGYGKGRSEQLMGMMLKDHHDECFIATKTPIPPGGWSTVTEEYVIEQTELSLKRLQVDYIDILQVHGIVFSQEERRAILEVVVPAFQKLQKAGKARFLGLTNQTSIAVDEFIESDLFDVLQIRYNILYQEPFDTFLDDAEKHNIGVTVNRPLTSGIFQKLMRSHNPGIDDVMNLNELCLDFVLSDPRVACAIVGMRRSEEVDLNNATSDSGRRLDLDALHDRQM